MPTYVYRRPDGTTFEVFQKISASALTEDPETGVPVKRVISGGAGLQFKGDGFYLTDYVRKGSGAESSESESPSKESTSKESTSGSKSTSESKVEPKSESKASSED